MSLFPSSFTRTTTSPLNLNARRLHSQLPPSSYLPLFSTHALLSLPPAQSTTHRPSPDPRCSHVPFYSCSPLSPRRRRPTSEAFLGTISLLLGLCFQVLHDALNFVHARLFGVRPDPQCACFQSLAHSLSLLRWIWGIVSFVQICHFIPRAQYPAPPAAKTR
ncbi:hypothetical protein B0H13DRAFT_139491 [Mycena leptocephala]|nr:hypothetical protein B0H13DRAFT_139491 [Mycena leptocephala]